MDFDQVADELYRLPPAEFTKARNARADLAKTNDRELAARIRDLRRPTAGAWLADTVAHRHPGETTRLEELGQALRDAQNSLDGDALRSLSEQRNDIVTALTSLGAPGALGAAHGEVWTGDPGAAQVQNDQVQAG